MRQQLVLLLFVCVSDGKYFSNMNMLWDGVTGQIVIRNVRAFSNNGTHSAITKDCRRLNPEESEVQAPRVALVMRDTVTSFLRRDCRVSKPLRSSPWSAVHYTIPMTNQGGAVWLPTWNTMAITRPTSSGLPSNFLT